MFILSDWVLDKFLSTPQENSLGRSNQKLVSVCDNVSSGPSSISSHYNRLFNMVRDNVSTKESSKPTPCCAVSISPQHQQLFYMVKPPAVSMSKSVLVADKTSPTVVQQKAIKTDSTAVVREAVSSASTTKSPELSQMTDNCNTLLTRAIRDSTIEACDPNSQEPLQGTFCSNLPSSVMLRCDPSAFGRPNQKHSFITEPSIYQVSIFLLNPPF